MTPQIPAPFAKLLREIGEVGGKATYLVGGFVRDLLLKRPSVDIDIVVEGDAIRVAEAMRHRWNGTLQVHAQFGTATVTSANPDYPKVDFATARRETYQCSGTLPSVKAGSISDDLQRRDFSINALAMRLDAGAFGTIIDETGGLADLTDGVIRVLHTRSFMDDPTRVFRALRYAGRYQFRIAETDKSLIREALPVLAQLSGERIRNEVDRVLLEENAPQILQQFTQFGIVDAIFEGWQIVPAFACEFQTAQRALTWASQHLADEAFRPALVRWMAFFGKTVPIYQIEALSFRFVLEHQLQRLVSRAQAFRRGVSLEKVTRFAFEKLGFPLAQSAWVEYQNGKWHIVDAEDRATYIIGEGNLYRVDTPLTAYRQLTLILEALTEVTAPGRIYQWLKPYPLEALVLVYLDETVPHSHREKVGNYLQNLRKIRPFVTGRDLIRWGEKPSKNFETLLAELFAAQLDGKITTKSEAYCYLRKVKKSANL